MGTIEKDQSSKGDQAGKRHRSPGYPVIALGDAIEKTKLVFQQDKRAFTTPDAIISHLGFKKGGSARRVVSALRQYGLLDEESGRYRVSELGFKLIHLSETSEERLRLVREAALNPPIIYRVIEHFQGELPSDTTLKEHLILTEKFNPDSVDLFIGVLRETLTLVKQLGMEYTPDQPTSKTETKTMSTSRQPQAKLDWMSSFQSRGEHAQTSGQLPFPLYLSKSQKAMLYVPASLTRKEYELLKRQIENSLAIMEATILSEHSDETGREE
jgi:hypothetical protein